MRKISLALPVAITLGGIGASIYYGEELAAQVLLSALSILVGVSLYLEFRSRRK